LSTAALKLTVTITGIGAATVVTAPLQVVLSLIHFRSIGLAPHLLLNFLAL
jgi:hypothetical protein